MNLFHNKSAFFTITTICISLLTLGMIELAWCGQSSPLVKPSALDLQVSSFLRENMHSWTGWNVPYEDGRILHDLVIKGQFKNILEIGTSTGYSGLWICLALQNTGGKLTTFEIDHGRAELAREHFRKAEVEQLTTVVEGDAHQNIAHLAAPIDIVFIDADKEGYLDYLNKLLPLVRPGGLIIADNLSQAPDYAKAVSANPELDTVYSGDGEELGISLKKR